MQRRDDPRRLREVDDDDEFDRWAQIKSAGVTASLCVRVNRPPHQHSTYSYTALADFEPCYRLFLSTTATNCLQCFDAVGWAAGRASGL